MSCLRRLELNLDEGHSAMYFDPDSPPPAGAGGAVPLSKLDAPHLYESQTLAVGFGRAIPTASRRYTLRPVPDNLYASICDAFKPLIAAWQRAGPHSRRGRDVPSPKMAGAEVDDLLKLALDLLDESWVDFVDFGGYHGL
ncbi:hypothetical protein BJY52DRAFT_1212619 [Lactarius psammicola]|nr:hypothetical protein BJY52DRAFT_1212619 [Lactarius psammicola]